MPMTDGVPSGVPSGISNRTPSGTPNGTSSGIADVRREDVAAAMALILRAAPPPPTPVPAVDTGGRHVASLPAVDTGGHQVASADGAKGSQGPPPYWPLAAHVERFIAEVGAGRWSLIGERR